MFDEEEFEFKKPEEEILPGEEPEPAPQPRIAKHSLSAIISSACGVLNLSVFIPRVFYTNYYSFAVSTPESFAAMVFMLTGLSFGIIAMVKPKGKSLFRYVGFWSNLLAVFLYLILAFYHLFFSETDF